MAANEKQVGGTHYKGNNEYQHWDVVIALNWDYLIGNATKYLWRLGRKGDLKKSIEDVEKAIHYLEKKKEVLQAEYALVAGTRKPVEAGKPGAVIYVDDKSIPATPWADLSRVNYVEEGYRTNGEMHLTCKHCKTTFWGTENQGRAHLLAVHGII
jgi:hypothetical protein